MKRIHLLIALLTLAPSAPVGRAAAADSDAKQPLPLTEVILYSSGVGFFERKGNVTDHAAVDLRFKVDDINDLLKSMVVQDLSGGRVTSVTYGSRDPLTKTLKSFGIDLTDNPSLGQLLNQVRGERVEVSWPNPTIGTILGVERKQQPVKDDKIVEVEYLNLSTADGLQSVPLAQVRNVKLLNDRLNSELNQALEVLATGHDTQKKTVSITFDGEGKRDVSVSYIAQTPVWKTSYRLVIDEKEPFLQGWAIVENTTDEDWDGVQLSLISGRPISFMMDLYQPLYTTRPVVQPELYLSLRPQVYQDSVEGQAESYAFFKGEGADVARRRALLRSAGGIGGIAAPPAAAPARDMAERGAGVAGIALGERLGREQRMELGMQTDAQGGVAGELFQYAIQTPVTIARQKSAMLPIVSQKIEGQKVSIYNQNVQAKFPLNGFRLKNSTALHLMQGPITVFEAAAYAGDARIEDLAPGQERLISYALDLKTEVETQSGGGPQELVSVKIRKGTFIATKKAFEEKTYNVRNRDQKKKTVLVEHPFRSDWTLTAPKESSERTRDVYRFAVAVEPDKTAKLQVREEKQIVEQVMMTDMQGEGITGYYLRSSKVSDKVKQALQKVVELRNVLQRTSAERVRNEQRSTEITQEQARIRENMGKLDQKSELYVRYMKKLDQQETELEDLRKKIESLKDTEARQQRELNDYMLNLEVD